MDDFAPLIRQRLRLILALGFFSGASALIQEIVWIRWFALVLGQGPQAMAIVLAIQMFGIGLGTLVAQRWAAGMQFPQAVRAYGVLEMGVGMAGAATVMVLPQAETILSRFSENASLWSHAAFALLVLLVPMVLIGGTFPLALAALKDAGAPCVPKIYGANVLGAAVGATSAGYILIPQLGLRGTFFVSLLFNFILAGILLRGKEKFPRFQGRFLLAGGVGGGRRVLLGLFLLGAGGMAAEVVWTRGLIIVLGSTTYTVSLVVGLFLAGTGLGSWLYSKKGPDWGFDSVPPGVGAGLVALAVFLSIPLLSWTPLAYSYAQALIGSSPMGRSFLRIFCAAALLLIPTIGMGAIFPWWVQTAKDCRIEKGYAVLCFGNAVGCLVAGWGMLPWMQLKNALMAVSALYVAAGALDPKIGSRRRWMMILLFGLGLLGLTSPVVWNPKVFSSGAFLYAPASGGWNGVERFWSLVQGHRLLFSQDGPSATVTVWQGPGRPPFLRINGKTDASIERDMETQKFSAILPLLLAGGGGGWKGRGPHTDMGAVHREKWSKPPFGAPAPDGAQSENGRVNLQVLVVGFGSGVTSGLLADDDRCASVTVVEIEPRVFEAGRWFSKENRHVLENGKLKKRVMDVRGWLLRDRTRYDIITAEPSNLWIGGMAHLFTREAFRLYRDRLKESGVFCQWVQGYGISEDDFRRVMATFGDVFPHVALVGVRNGDFFMLGSLRPWENLEDFLGNPGGPKIHLSPKVGSEKTTESPLPLWVLGERSFRHSSQGFGIHTDDRPFLEFSTPSQMWNDSSVEIQSHLMLESLNLP